MSNENHLTFNRLIYVDGKLAAEVVKADTDYFLAAYKALFPDANITILSPLQALRARAKATDEAESDLIAQEQPEGTG